MRPVRTDLPAIYKFDEELLPKNGTGLGSWVSSFEVVDGQGLFSLSMVYQSEKHTALVLLVPSTSTRAALIKISKRAMKFAKDCGEICAEDAGLVRIKKPR